MPQGGRGVRRPSCLAFLLLGCFSHRTTAAAAATATAGTSTRRHSSTSSTSSSSQPSAAFILAASVRSTTRMAAKATTGAQATPTAPGMIRLEDGEICFSLGKGVRPMPAVGLGTFQVKGEAAYDAVAEALRRGYRHIDTAAVYRNEEAVGRAIRDSGLPRESVFVTTKLAPKDQGAGKAYAALCASLAALDVGPIDLYLIHWPGASGLKSEDPDNARLRHESYRELQRGLEEGKVRCLGVSNFNERHLSALLADPTITHPPKVNQVEVHPFFPQRALRAYCRQHGVLVQAYSSLGQSDPGLREHRVVREVAARRGMTPAQVLLRWALDQGMPVIPKTTHPQRMAENLAALTACPPLEPDDMKALDALDKGPGAKFAWDPEKVV